jgi:hypothetical protein
VAFADFDAYIDALRVNSAADFLQSAQSGFLAARLGDLSRAFVPAPAVPTASVALSKTSDRSINGAVPDAGAGRLSILAGRINPGGVSGVAVMLVDMLNISGGLNATVTTAQTTNLPTAALTRYTSGEGVHAALMIHTAVGNTATTVTCSYTNQSGTPGQITPAVVFGGTGLTGAGTLIRLPLAGGDTGMRSVESVTLAGSTAVAGNFGVVMFKPLAMLFANDVEGANVIDTVSSGRMVGQFNEVLDGACLSCFAVMATAQQVAGAILLGEA